jgi:hypothetical protein
MRVALLFALVLAATPALAADPTPSTVDPKAGEGCWVRFFSAKDFKQPMGRLAGATYINSLAAPGLIGNLDVKEYFGLVRSAVVGPEALLVLYAEPGFREESAKLDPGRKVADLGEFGFPKNVASLKIICAKAR